MKRIAIEECTLSVQDLVQIAEAETVVLTRQGTPIVGIVGVDESEVEAWSLGSNPDFLALIERSRERGRREGGIALEKVRCRLGIPRGAGDTSPPGEAVEDRPRSSPDRGRSSAESSQNRLHQALTLVQELGGLCLAI